MTTAQDIQTLIDQKKFAEADALIKSQVSQKLTDREKGAALIHVASTYVKLSNDVSKGYRDALQDAITALKSVKTSGTKIQEKISMEEVREKLNSQN